jgi:hypothetical protein
VEGTARPPALPHEGTREAGAATTPNTVTIDATSTFDQTASGWVTRRLVPLRQRGCQSVNEIQQI